MLVIGVGNPERGDDAAGWLVAQRLADRCDTMLSAGDPAGLIEAWRNRNRVVLVDAVRSGAPPGTVEVIDLIRRRLKVPAVSSSHGLGPIQAVDLGAAIGVLPASLTLIAIEGTDFSYRTGVTPEVAGGLDRAVDLIDRWIAEENQDTI